MIDQEKWIASQAIMKALLENIPYKEWQDLIPVAFKATLQTMEDYATLNADEEWVNLEIPITKEFWNQTPQIQNQWLTEWGKPMPVVNKVGRKEWYVHAQRRNLDKVKKIFGEREDSFSEMVNVQKQKEVKI